MNYATTAELATYLDPDAETPTVPPLASVLIRHASGLVAGNASAPYRTDADGLPTDPRVLATLKAATLEQASAWALHELDPRKGAAQIPRSVKAKSLNGASVTYDDDASGGALIALARGDTLTGAAWAVLEQGGLVTNRVSLLGSVERFNVAQRHYDPLTGEFQEPVI